MLLNDADMRREFGTNAKKRVLTEFGMEKLGDRAENQYRRIIESFGQAGKSNI